MNLNRRIEGLEREYGKPTGVRTVIWMGSEEEEPTRSIVEKCRAEGVGIRVITFSVKHHADTVEEAQELVASHKAKHPDTAITVFLRSYDEVKVLASYNPGLPAWLSAGVKGNSGETDDE
ncbi:MAG TPA: hypothetical protein PKA37_18680 [Planctomycetota bacterium]|nr:hypothetical protein [Planctomycetota bacterium]